MSERFEYRIVSIGALSRHDLWEHAQPARTAHATTTLIRSGDRVILVDPALPPQALGPRMGERSGLMPKEVTDVFLTCFRPAHRMGLELFEQANWWIAEREREAVGQGLIQGLDQATDDATKDYLRREVTLLQRCKNAPDRLAERVDLFPVPGPTPGGCGLLLLEPRATVLVAGDAVGTLEHLERGQILSGAMDIETAKESLTEALEIADVIIPGHDNIVLNPVRSGRR